MTTAARQFQVFAKPIGPVCNLACDYCYYLDQRQLYQKNETFRMPEEMLGTYIQQQIEACPDPVIPFSWHGGEPTLLGVDWFRKAVALQREHMPPGRRAANGIQTNGTRLNPAWCRFLASAGFGVGVSLDGPADLHNAHRVTRDRRPSHRQAVRGYRLLQRSEVPTEILCVVSAANVGHPLRVYRYFKQLGARYITFLPLVEPQPTAPAGVSPRSVPPEAFGAFLCAIFDEWTAQDIGRVKVQIFEEAARTAFGQEHTLCVFRETCGDVPVVEHNGDFYSCDHYCDPDHRLGNIGQTHLVELLESPAQRAFGRRKRDTLPQVCLSCEVRAMCNGGCPKNRIRRAPDGQAGLNYLCAGYKRFFSHCRPFVAAVAALWRRQGPTGQPS